MGLIRGLKSVNKSDLIQTFDLAFLLFLLGSLTQNWRVDFIAQKLAAFEVLFTLEN